MFIKYIVVWRLFESFCDFNILQFSLAMPACCHEMLAGWRRFIQWQCRPYSYRGRKSPDLDIPSGWKY